MFYVSRGTFWGKTTLWKQICYDFSNFSGQLESIKGNLSDKMLKVQSTCQDEQFEETYFLLEKNFLRIIWGNIFFTWEKFQNLNWELSAFRANSFAWSSKCTLHLQRMSLQRVYRLQIYYCLFFRHFEQISFRRFSVFFSKGKKTAFHVFKRTFWAKISYWQNCLHLKFLDFKWKTLNFMGNSISFCRVVVKTIKHLSGKTISPQLFL